MITNEDLEYFNVELPHFLKDQHNKFVVIRNKKRFGFFRSPEEALKKGYDKFGDTEFLVHEVTNKEVEEEIITTHHYVDVLNYGSGRDRPKEIVKLIGHIKREKVNE